MPRKPEPLTAGEIVEIIDSLIPRDIHGVFDSHGNTADGRYVIVLQAVRCKRCNTLDLPHGTEGLCVYCALAEENASRQAELAAGTGK